MADLVLTFGLWSGYLDPSEQITTIEILDNDIFLGCHSGNIYVLHRNTLKGRLLFVPAKKAKIVGLAIGKYVIDQPHSTIPSLLSIDSCGYHFGLLKILILLVTYQLGLFKMVDVSCTM